MQTLGSSSLLWPLSFGLFSSPFDTPYSLSLSLSKIHTFSLSLFSSLCKSKPLLIPYKYPLLFFFFLYISTLSLSLSKALLVKMVRLLEMNGDFVDDKEKRPKFCINDHADILIEILQRLDGHSLGAAACVCRLWRSIARNDWLWEHLCFRQVSPPPPQGVRLVVAALGGYRRLYMVCLRPVLSRLSRRKKLGLGGAAGSGDSEVVRRVRTRHEVELSLSLFCIDYYERLGGSGGRLGDGTSSSLMFLCKPVNV